MIICTKLEQYFTSDSNVRKINWSVIAEKMADEEIKMVNVENDGFTYNEENLPFFSLEDTSTGHNMEETND